MIENSAEHGAVLVVDDDSVVLLVIGKILRLAGYRVFSALDHKTALDICEVHGGSLSLALLDYLMPGMSGPELLTRLKELRPALPVAMMSGFTQSEIESSGVPFTRCAFLQKPFTRGELLAFIESAIDRGGEQSAGGSGG